MDYCNMTDDQINAEVASTLGLHANNAAPTDYCGSWEHAGPIIEKASIALFQRLDFDLLKTSSPDESVLWVATTDIYQSVKNEKANNSIEFSDRNPRRAALVLFLVEENS